MEVKEVAIAADKLVIDYEGACIKISNVMEHAIFAHVTTLLDNIYRIRIIVCAEGVTIEYYRRQDNMYVYSRNISLKELTQTVNTTSIMKKLKKE